MHRNAIGIEISPEYYQRVKNILEPVQLVLLEPTEKYGKYKTFKT